MRPMQSPLALAVAMTILAISISALIIALGRPAREVTMPSKALEPEPVPAIGPSLPDREKPDKEPEAPAPAVPEGKKRDARIAAVETRVEGVRVLLSKMAKTFFVEADVERPAIVTKEDDKDRGEMVGEYASIDLADMAAEEVLAVEYEYLNSKGELAWDRCAENEFLVKDGKLLLWTK